jgi:hypothetical protein
MTEREYRLSLITDPKQSRAKLGVAVCLFWLVACLIGLATHAFAGPVSGLRGSSDSAPTVQTKALSSPRTTSNAGASAPQSWLGTSVWRAGPCNASGNFQTFAFTPAAPKVEVGSGRPGEGERLELLRISALPDNLIQIETRVCAPVGCNQTVERYKKLDANTMQEWHFEGRLPDHVPYVIVANGVAVDGSGPGRVFNRCGG